MDKYEEGDRLFLFGFSRGAYTIRALAGMLHNCGPLECDRDNLLPNAMKVYERVTARQERRAGWFTTIADVHIQAWDSEYRRVSLQRALVLKDATTFPRGHRVIAKPV